MCAEKELVLCSSCGKSFKSARIGPHRKSCIRRIRRANEDLAHLDVLRTGKSSHFLLLSIDLNQSDTKIAVVTPMMKQSSLMLEMKALPRFKVSIIQNISDPFCHSLQILIIFGRHRMKLRHRWTLMKAQKLTVRSTLCIMWFAVN